MVVKCGACNEEIEILNGVADGTTVLCPHCNEMMIYKASLPTTIRGEGSTYAKPSRIELPTDVDARPKAARSANVVPPIGAAGKPKLGLRRAPESPSFTSERAQQIMERIQNKEIKEREERIRIMSEQRNLAIVISLSVIAVIVALSIYLWNVNRRQAELDIVLNEVANDTLAGEEVPNYAKQLAEETAEREKKRKEADAEREQRRADAEAERTKKRLAREQELQVQKAKAESEKANRERMDEVDNRFRSASIVFASDFSSDKSPLKKDGSFYAIGLDYISEQRIYEALVEHGAVVAVRVFSPRSEPTDVDVAAFTTGIMNSRILVLGEDGLVWICGTGKSFWTEKVSLAKEPIAPAKIELGELHSILSNWGRLPNLKYRLTLKSGKNGVPVKGGKEIQLGIIEYDTTIPSDKIRDAVLTPMQKQREKAADIKPPKLKKFTPTVVFYDGNIISQEMRVTKVPRNWCKDNRWGRLRDEAERQERMKNKVLRENDRIMREYEENVRKILNKGISGEQIEAELQKYVLLIERSRSRLPK